MKSSIKKCKISFQKCKIFDPLTRATTGRSQLATTMTSSLKFKMRKCGNRGNRVQNEKIPTIFTVTASTKPPGHKVEI